MKLTVKAALLAMVALTASPALAEIRASASVNSTGTGPVIRPEIYGQFAEHLGTGIDGGIWVGENSSIPNVRGYRRDVVDALKALKVPVVRWPGGCFADIYRWRDGIGPRAQRPVTLNMWWGNTEENNHFGTHEFFDFAELIGAKTYLNVNVGTGTAGEAREWLEYITSPSNSSMAKLRRANGRDKPWKVDYVGIGNEMWGCGANITASDFAPMARQYSTFLNEKGVTLIAGGASGDDYDWTEKVLAGKRGELDAISLHYYTLPTGNWDKKGPAVGFTEADWAATFARTRRLDTYIAEHDKRMDAVDPEQKLGLMVAEWGTWYDATPGTNTAFLQQENTLRDALIAATNFHIFHRHADRVHMANIAQMVNVLQAMILTNGPQMSLTPTYHAFMMYQPFQGATALPLEVSSPEFRAGADSVPAVDVTAARDKAGAVHVGLVNVDPDENATLELDLGAFRGRRIEGLVLTASKMDAQNRLGARPEVTPVRFNGASWSGGKLRVRMPAKSLVRLTLR
ncbi:alpha-N-arabinofuranosidase [Sphingomonas piscis]|uniref:non-reducing end alpha-L-arabinofuranosidase n=1 Tax=Sphingomonas piscis TaxID=2714943 RepID=A0A6G7YQX7_9SPHN|nr:alpha-L-arabinofuranosidase C-terminal domain-containing protein [Sphingomonas piscis]QIK79141.1 alpha-N-arabinofuranosidase [Sphingomonas piscis]